MLEGVATLGGGVLGGASGTPAGKIVLPAPGSLHLHVATCKSRLTSQASSRPMPRLPSVHLDSCLRGFTTTPSQHLEARFCNTVEQRVGHHGILASGSVDNHR